MNIPNLPTYLPEAVVSLAFLIGGLLLAGGLV